MKLTINADELRSWGVCKNGLEEFVKAHGEKTVSLEKALESNTVKDFFYVFDRNKNRFPDAQVKDIKLLICDFAEHVLAFFEEEYPKDKRPRKAIETARKYINGDASTDDVVVAAADATDAAHSVTSAFYIAAAVADVVIAALDDDAFAAHFVVSAASIYAYVAGRKDEQQWQRQKLIELIEKWKKDFTIKVVNDENINKKSLDLKNTI